MNLFSADRLRKAADNPLPGQRQAKPQAEEINGEPEYEVERVETSRLQGRRKELQYRVTWRGWDPDDTWYPARDLRNAPGALEDFHRRQPDAPGPPVRLQEWMRAAADEIFAPDHDDDNKAVSEGRKPARKTKPRHT